MKWLDLGHCWINLELCRKISAEKFRDTEWEQDCYTVVFEFDKEQKIEVNWGDSIWEDFKNKFKKSEL